MDYLSVFLIGIGLSMDAFAVTIAGGCLLKPFRILDGLKLSIAFGLFQFIMPLIGWFLGTRIQRGIATVDHWVAFGLLCLVGGKMIYEGLKPAENENRFKELGLKVLFILALATSIDALAVGLSLAFLKTSILWPAAIIGAITFTLSLIGFYIGKGFGGLFKDKAEIAGGLILIGIGLKILIEHSLG